MKAEHPKSIRQKAVQRRLKKYSRPFTYSGEDNERFTCLCGAKGSRSYVFVDAGGTYFSVGVSCVSLIGKFLGRTPRVYTSEHVLVKKSNMLLLGDYSRLLSLYTSNIPHYVFENMAAFETEILHRMRLYKVRKP